MALFKEKKKKKSTDNIKLTLDAKHKQFLSKLDENKDLLPQLENIISNQPVLPQEFNLFTNLINNITTNNFYNNNLQPVPEYEEDVLVTLDDKDLNDLITSKASGNEDRCTICLCDIEEDEDIINLKCSHTFHDECLRQYLKDYDFKCPICREEVGKSKAHV